MEKSTRGVHSDRPRLVALRTARRAFGGTAGRLPAAAVILSIVAAGTVLAGAAAATGWYLNRPPAPQASAAQYSAARQSAAQHSAAQQASAEPAAAPAGGELRRFTVTNGETLAAVAERLHRARIIRSPLLLRALAKARGTESAVKVGDFGFPADATTVEIHDLLVAGAIALVRFTVPEGWTISRIAAHLEHSGVTGAAEFTAAAQSGELLSAYGIDAPSAEGYLFPDTYFFPRGYPAAAVANHMIDTFFVRLSDIFPAHAASDPAELHRKVILASIVEREYRIPDEAPVIASVFYNRLGVDVGLESCATIVYIITELQGKEHPARILHSDLKIDSRFNTYKWHGLPPGPIANPGTTALRATLFPADTDYWYFVVKDPATGAHHFSRDLDEHSEAKFIYLKGVSTPVRTRS